MSSAAYVVCYIFLQTFQTYILHIGKQCGPRSDLKEQSDLGPHCLQQWVLK